MNLSVTAVIIVWPLSSISIVTLVRSNFARMREPAPLVISLHFRHATDVKLFIIAIRCVSRSAHLLLDNLLRLFTNCKIEGLPNCSMDSSPRVRMQGFQKGQRNHATKGQTPSSILKMTLPARFAIRLLSLEKRGSLEPSYSWVSTISSSVSGTCPKNVPQHLDKP
jgi:uncharacterized protein YjhX (UPF0386 family)